MNNSKIIMADIVGGNGNKDLKGIMLFHPVRNGTLVEVEVYNMPKDNSHPYALHIHEGGVCDNDNFSKALGHYNPGNYKHPMHAGDLPPLLSNNGYSYMMVYTDRFTPQEVIGKTVIIHSGSDDFHSQPAGGSGSRIACGVIKQNL